MKKQTIMRRRGWLNLHAVLICLRLISMANYPKLAALEASVRAG